MGPTTTEAPAPQRSATLAISSSPTLAKFRESRDGGKPVVLFVGRPGDMSRRCEVAIVEVEHDNTTHHISFRGSVCASGVEVARGQVYGEIFPNNRARSFLAYTAKTPPA